MSPGREPSGGRLAFQDMPDEILEAILGRLGAPQLAQVRLTCKRLAAVGMRPHLPPRQEQLQLALDALTRSGKEMVMPGWGNARGIRLTTATRSGKEFGTPGWGTSRGIRPATAQDRRKWLLRQAHLTETLQHMPTLDIANCGQVFELVIPRLHGSNALRALRLSNIMITEKRAAALHAAGILGGLERLDVMDGMGQPTREGCWRLLGIPGLERLRTLALAGHASFFHNPLGGAAATVARLARLESLSLQVVDWSYGTERANRRQLVDLPARSGRWPR